MFPYVFNFTHQLFFPSNLFHRNWDCLGFFSSTKSVSCKSVFFMSYCNEEAIMTKFFYIILQGGEYNKSNIARIKELQYEIKMQQSIFLHAVNCKDNNNKHIVNVVLQEKWQQLYFWCCKKWSYYEGACNSNKSTTAGCKNAALKF